MKTPGQGESDFSGPETNWRDGTREKEKVDIWVFWGRVKFLGEAYSCGFETNHEIEIHRTDSGKDY